MTLRHWKARRAGGRITINGVDALTGVSCKVVGVDVIEPRNGRVVAVDKAGGEHTLEI